VTAHRRSASRSGSWTRPTCLALGIPLRGYDLSPDGQRFIVIKEQSQQAERPATLSTMTVVLDWFEELRARTARR
jgi:hypothetical protein